MHSFSVFIFCCCCLITLKHTYILYLEYFYFIFIFVIISDMDDVWGKRQQLIFDHVFTNVSIDDDGEVPPESETAVKHIINEGYRLGKISGEEIYRQEGFDKGMKMGLLVGKLCGRFIAETSVHGPDIQREVHNVLKGQDNIRTDTVAKICSELSNILQNGGVDIASVEDFRNALLMILDDTPEVS